MVGSAAYQVEIGIGTLDKLDQPRHHDSKFYRPLLSEPLNFSFDSIFSAEHLCGVSGCSLSGRVRRSGGGSEASLYGEIGKRVIRLMSSGASQPYLIPGYT